MPGVVVHRFGPFELDPSSRQLFRAQKRVHLSGPQSAILTLFVTNPGVTFSKERLIDSAWGGMAINENSVEKAVSKLRKVLGDGIGDGHCIETLPHEGYRFTAPVQQAEQPRAHASLDTHLEPYLKFVQGRTNLDTLDRKALAEARGEFEAALRLAPDYTPARVGLAMACGLAYEASTADAEQDVASLDLAVACARQASMLTPRSGEAWSTFAFVLALKAAREESAAITKQAAAAAHLAMELEPGDSRRALRAAYATWGDERLRAAQHVLTLRPGLALAHWLRTTVFIARGAFEAAFEEVRLGCAAQDAQLNNAGLPAVGLHLLHAHLLAVHERLDEAVAALKRELTWTDSEHMYARVCASNTWYVLGAIYLRQRKRAEAEAAFERALTIAPRHVSAAAALRGEVPGGPPKGGPYVRDMDVALARAIVLARGNRHADAAHTFRDVLAQRPPGPAGWILPVEPFLNPLARRDVWSDALTMVRVRAT